MIKSQSSVYVLNQCFPTFFAFISLKVFKIEFLFMYIKNKICIKDMLKNKQFLSEIKKAEKNFFVGFT